MVQHNVAGRWHKCAQESVVPLFGRPRVSTAVEGQRRSPPGCDHATGVQHSQRNAGHTQVHTETSLKHKNLQGHTVDPAQRHPRVVLELAATRRLSGRRAQPSGRPRAIPSGRSDAVEVPKDNTCKMIKPYFSFTSHKAAITNAFVSNRTTMPKKCPPATRQRCSSRCAPNFDPLCSISFWRNSNGRASGLSDGWRTRKVLPPPRWLAMC